MSQCGLAAKVVDSVPAVSEAVRPDGRKNFARMRASCSAIHTHAQKLAGNVPGRSPRGTTSRKTKNKANSAKMAVRDEERERKDDKTKPILADIRPARGQ